MAWAELLGMLVYELVDLFLLGMLVYKPVDLFLLDRTVSHSEGGSFVLHQGSFSLFPYDCFHLIGLDPLVESPFPDSVFVLLCTDTVLVVGILCTVECNPHVASSPYRSLMTPRTCCRVFELYSLEISAL
jgi:hypothetical protein